jgi:hypothetical protein
MFLLKKSVINEQVQESLSMTVKDLVIYQSELKEREEQ